MKRWIIRILSVLIVFLVVGYFFAKSYVTKNFIVAKIEKSINSRVQIEDLNVSFYGFSGSAELSNVIITERDSNADDKIPHDDREKIDSGDLTFETAKFDVSIWDVFSKEILVEEINLDGVVINCALDEDGDASIESLFINVNPKKLETINNAKIILDGVFGFKSLESGADYGKFIPVGEADVTLFNASNGDLEPDMVLTLTVDSESYLTSDIPMAKGIWNAAKYVNKLGIEMIQIPSKAKFKNDQSFKVAYKLAKSTLLEPLSIKIEDWELELLSQSWLETGNDQHQIGVKLHIGKIISGALDSLLRNTSKLGGVISDFAGVESMLEDGRLALHLESSGDLSNPDVSLKNDFAKPGVELLEGVLKRDKDEIKEEVKKHLKKKGRDLLKGFLK